MSQDRIICTNESLKVRELLAWIVLYFAKKIKNAILGRIQLACKKSSLLITYML